jgi:predicted secreted hydrolase
MPLREPMNRCWTRWTLPVALMLASAAFDVRQSGSSEPVVFPQVTSGVPLQFPRDHGAHPDFRVEWWYVTGSIHTAESGETLGFQITLFRVRPEIDAANPSAFTPRQVLLGHCAIADPAHGRLWQEQRVRRAGLGLADARSQDLKVWLDDWKLERRADSPQDVYLLQASSQQCGLDLTLTATEPPLFNGDAGFSQKGPAPHSASEYYSEPHLRVTVAIERPTRRDQVSGEAWLDHEWASEYLDPNAVGWDWIGINLDDGGALMAFEIRDRQGQRYWAAGTLRDAHGQVQRFAPQEIGFTPLRRWRSPRSGVLYPVAQRVRIGGHELELTPLLDDQEFDARVSAGTLYWEGAVTASERGQARGHGYLELTGYAQPLALP